MAHLFITLSCLTNQHTHANNVHEQLNFKEMIRNMHIHNVDKTIYYAASDSSLPASQIPHNHE